MSGWRARERARLKALLKDHNITERSSPVGIGAIITIVEGVGPGWYHGVPANERRRLIALTMRELGFIGHTKGTGGKITSWVQPGQERATA